MPYLPLSLPCHFLKEHHPVKLTEEGPWTKQTHISRKAWIWRSYGSFEQLGSIIPPVWMFCLLIYPIQDNLSLVKTLSRDLCDCHLERLRDLSAPNSQRGSSSEINTVTYKKQKEHLFWTRCVIAYHCNGLLYGHCEVPGDDLRPVCRAGLESAALFLWSLEPEFLTPYM